MLGASRYFQGFILLAIASVANRVLRGVMNLGNGMRCRAERSLNRAEGTSSAPELSSRGACDGSTPRSCIITAHRTFSDGEYGSAALARSSAIKGSRLARQASSIMRKQTGEIFRSHCRGSQSGGCSSNVIHALSTATASRSWAAGRPPSRRSIWRTTSSFRRSTVRADSLRGRISACCQAAGRRTATAEGRPIH